MCTHSIGNDVTIGSSILAEVVKKRNENKHNTIVKHSSVRNLKYKYGMPSTPYFLNLKTNIIGMYNVY